MEGVPMSKWPLTPLIPTSHVASLCRQVIDLPDHRCYPLEEYGKLRADGGRGSSEDNCTGILGEESLADYLGLEQGVDTRIYDNGGDGGVDLHYRGQTIDVKTASRDQRNPSLLVGAYQPLRADYYALVHRIGRTQFRLIGYSPRQFVANSPTREYEGEKVHVVPQENLFPFPLSIKKR